PLVVDCTSGRASAAVPSTDPFVLATIADLKAGRPGQFARRCDRFGAKPPQYEALAEVCRAAPRFIGGPTVATLEGLLVAVKKCGGVTHRSRLEEWLVNKIDEVLRSKYEPLIKDAAVQRDGPARLAEALSFSEPILTSLGRLGANAQRRDKSDMADAIATALLSLGEQGKEVGRAAADLEHSPGFRARFEDAPPPKPPEPQVGGPAGPRPLPKPRPGGVGRVGGAYGGVPRGSWREADQSCDSSGGRVIPWLATIVTLAALALPVFDHSIRLKAPSPVMVMAQWGVKEAPPSCGGDLGLSDRASRLWNRVSALPSVTLSAAKEAWAKSFYDLVARAVLLAVAVVLLWMYGPLTGWLVDKCGLIGAYLPMVLALGIAVASLGMPRFFGDSGSERRPPSKPHPQARAQP
ncbi:MAG: hypothetical protein ACR2IT_13285, partial [Pirellulales bacterium]